MLQAHVAASHPLAQEADAQSRHFKPMALYARVAHFYHFSDLEMRKMHYPRFFGYIREANVIIEEQRQAQQPNNRVHGSQMIDDPNLAQLMLRKHFGKPQQYQGQTVQLND